MTVPAAGEREEAGAAAGGEGGEFLLRRGFAEGTRTYGSLPLAYEEYARGFLVRVTRRLAAAGVPATPAAVGDGVARSAGADLFLAIGCDEGLPEAWSVLAREFVPACGGCSSATERAATRRRISRATCRGTPQRRRRGAGRGPGSGPTTGAGASSGGSE